ncbi:MAG: transcriptional repressor [Candidatus Kerfeldbacteria bacterium]|nr:transcriptional repressor [Candidatus Kerfeldbacteria bacterium]
MESTATMLHQAGLRATNARTTIVNWLTRQHQPVRVEAVWEHTKKSGIDRVTVYRTMEALQGAGIVQQVDLGHSHAHYELNDPQRHHHHLVCESCGAVKDVTIKVEAKLIRELERQYNFRTRSHAIELFGLCQDCQ